MTLEVVKQKSDMPGIVIGKEINSIQNGENTKGQEAETN